MPILANLDLIRVTGRFVLLDGRPAQGTVLFAPNTVLVDPGTKEIIKPVDFVATIDADGYIIGQDSEGRLPGDDGYVPTPGVLLPSTDDPDLAPTGWTYQVTERISAPAKVTRRYNLQLPYNLAGSTFDLSEVSPGTPPTPGQVQYVVLSDFRSWVPADGEEGQFLQFDEGGGGRWVAVEPGGGVSQEYVDGQVGGAVAAAESYTDGALGSAVSALEGAIGDAQTAAVAAATGAALATHEVLRFYDPVEEQWPPRDAPPWARVRWCGRGVALAGPDPEQPDPPLDFDKFDPERAKATAP